jgi:hypothetical protein
MEHYDVLIATPGTDLKAAYVDSLVKTLAECDKRGLTYKWLNGQSSLVHHAREITMSGDMRLDPDDKGPMHGQVTYNKIVWIDSDIEWTKEDFFRLYDSEHEVISGVYLLSDNTTTTIHTQEYLHGIPKNVILQMTDPVQVQSIGFGFVAMKSGVFERMERPWFAHLSQYIVNSRGEKLPDSLGEDISWCVRAYNAKIPVMFDPKVLVNHIKTGKITWK